MSVIKFYDIFDLGFCRDLDEGYLLYRAIRWGEFNGPYFNRSTDDILVRWIEGPDGMLLHLPDRYAANDCLHFLEEAYTDRDRGISFIDSFRQLHENLVHEMSIGHLPFNLSDCFRNPAQVDIGPIPSHVSEPDWAPDAAVLEAQEPDFDRVYNA